VQQFDLVQCDTCRLSGLFRVVTLTAATLVVRTFRRDGQAKALRQYQHERCSKLRVQCSQAAQRTASNKQQHLK